MNFRHPPLPIDVERVHLFLPWWDRILALVVLVAGCAAIAALVWAACLRP